MALPGQTIHIVAVLVLGPHHVAQKRNVAYRELQRIHFAESLFVGQSRNVRSESLECLVDALHASPFPQISRLPLLCLLRCTFGAP